MFRPTYLYDKPIIVFPNKTPVWLVMLNQLAALYMYWMLCTTLVPWVYHQRKNALDLNTEFCETGTYCYMLWLAELYCATQIIRYHKDSLSSISGTKIMSNSSSKNCTFFQIFYKYSLLNIRSIVYLYLMLNFIQ